MSTYFHSDIILQGLKDLYESRELTDVVLQSVKTEIPCHKNVLASCSRYFRAMFTVELKESDEHVIELHDVDPDILSLIINFIYSGEVHINNSNIQSLMTVSNMLQIDALTRLCINYATREIDIENCIDVYNMADLVNLPDLKASAKKFVFDNFERISETDALCYASLDFLMELLSEDDLITEQEKTVYYVLEKWVLFDSQIRKEHFSDLFKFIRIPLLDKSFVTSNLTCNELVKTNPSCCDMISNAFPSDQTNTSQSNAVLRKGMYSRQVLIFSGGSVSKDSRSFSCFDTETHTSYAGVQQHPVFDAQYKIDHYQLLVTINNTILFIGGIWKQSTSIQGNNAIADVYKYIQRDRKWEKCLSMTHARSSFAACNYEERVYVFGGLTKYPNGRATDSAEFYNPDLDVWQPIQPMPVGISNQTVTRWKNSIFLFGGIDDETAYLNTVLMYSIFRDTWSLIPTELNRPRCGCSAFTFQNLIYIFGGANKYENIVSVDIYNPERNQWLEGQKFPEEKKIISMAMHADSLFVCGGFKNLDTRQGYHRRTRTVETKDLFKYDFINDKWSRITRMIPLASNVCCGSALVNITFLEEFKT